MARLKNQIPQTRTNPTTGAPLTHAVTATMRWVACWMAHVALVIAIGGVAGTLIAPLVKLALTADWAWDLTFSNGALIGMKYAGLWAMGIALIWCVMRHNRRAKDSSSPSGPTIC